MADERWVIYVVPADHETPIHIWTPDGETLRCQSVTIDGPSRVVSVIPSDPLLSPEGRYLVAWVETESAMHMEGAVQ